MTSPFDPKSAIFAKHAQHVALVHFPIALTITAIIFDWVAALCPGPRGKALIGTAYSNVTVAAAAAVKSPRPPMPPLHPMVLTDADVDDVSQFVGKLSDSRKPSVK